MKFAGQLGCKILLELESFYKVNMLHDIKFVVMDVDGTLTDGIIYMGNNGEVMKAFNIKDGYGISHLLPTYDIIPVIITGRESNILVNRCIELGIRDVYQGITDKASTLFAILENYNSKLSNVVYIGDDLNDKEVMIIIKESGGIVACPADSSEGVIEICDYVSTKPGGKGAVREIIEYILKNKISNKTD